MYGWIFSLHWLCFTDSTVCLAVCVLLLKVSSTTTSMIRKRKLHTTNFTKVSTEVRTKMCWLRCTIGWISCKSRELLHAGSFSSTPMTPALSPRQLPLLLLPLRRLQPFLPPPPFWSFLAVPEITTNPELNNYLSGSIPDVTDEPTMFNIQNVLSEVPTDSSTREFNRYVDGKNMWSFSGKTTVNGYSDF